MFLWIADIDDFLLWSLGYAKSDSSCSSKELPEYFLLSNYIDVGLVYYLEKSCHTFSVWYSNFWNMSTRDWIVPLLTASCCLLSDIESKNSFCYSFWMNCSLNLLILDLSFTLKALMVDMPISLVL